MLAGDDSAAPIAHSILWLCSALAAEQPLALVVDDAQWADRVSLEVLAYLARRVEDLPLLILVAARADDPARLGSAEPARHRSATVLHPRPLTPRGAAQLIRRLAPDTPAAVSATAIARSAATRGCWPSSAARRDRRPADADAVSPSARTVVRRRLAELAPRDRGVVAALAVIGDGAPPHVARAVAGVPVGELGPARDALLAAGLLGARRRALRARR